MDSEEIHKILDANKISYRRPLIFGHGCTVPVFEDRDNCDLHVAYDEDEKVISVRWLGGYKWRPVIRGKASQ